MRSRSRRTNWLRWKDSWMQRKSSEIFNHWWRNSVEGAIPARRKVDITFIQLFRNSAEGEEFVGSFVPELYELASTPTGSLRCQIEEKEWIKERLDHGEGATSEDLRTDNPALYKQLYRADGYLERKSKFELAVLPTRNDIKLAEYMSKEYRYRRDRKLPLPAEIFKIQAVNDYLKDIRKAGLYVKSPVGEDFKLNIVNPARKATTREKIVHYVGQWTALFLTISAAIAAIELEVLLGMSSPWVIATALAIPYVRVYLANKSNHDDGMFGLAEHVHRNLGWLFSKELSWRGKLSVSKSLWTITYLACIGIAAYGAGYATLASTLNLPWAELAKLSNLPNLVGYTQMAFAGFLAGVTGIGAFLGGASSIRYFKGLSFWNNQIEFTLMMGHQLRAISVSKEPRPTMERKYDHNLSNLVRQLEKLKDNSSGSDVDEELEKRITVFKDLLAHPEHLDRVLQPDPAPRPLHRALVNRGAMTSAPNGETAELRTPLNGETIVPTSPLNGETAVSTPPAAKETQNGLVQQRRSSRSSKSKDAANDGVKDNAQQASHRSTKKPT